MFSGITGSATRIRYQTSSSMWEQRSLLEKALLVLVATLLFVIMVLTIILHSAEDRLAVQRVFISPPLPQKKSTMQFIQQYLQL